MKDVIYSCHYIILAKNDLQKGVSKTFLYLCLSVISCHCDLAIIIIPISIVLSSVYCYILFKCITLKLEESETIFPAGLAASHLRSSLCLNNSQKSYIRHCVNTS